MDEELADIFLGGDISDEIIGKAPDWTAPFRKFAIIFIVCLVGNIIISLFIEKYRFGAAIQEVRSLTLNGIQCSVEEVQNLGENEMEYLFDDSGNPTSEYEEYLNRLQSKAIETGDNELKQVVKLLKYGDVNGEKYTPLSFNLTYLNEEKLKDTVESNLIQMFETNNSDEFSRGNDSLGSVLENLLFGNDRTQFESCDVNIHDPEIIDITDVDGLEPEELAMYRAVYGTDNPNVSKLDGLGLTDRRYLVVYQVDYTINWDFYTRTLYFRKPGAMQNENSSGFGSLCRVTDSYTELYYITN